MASFPNSQSNAKSAIPVWICSSPNGQTVKNITANGNTLVMSGAGTFDSVTIGVAGTGSTMTVYDGTSAAGTLLGTISTTAQNTLTPGWTFQTGLFIVTAGSGAANLTVTAH